MAQATVKSAALEMQAVFSYFTIEQWMWTLPSWDLYPDHMSVLHKSVRFEVYETTLYCCHPLSFLRHWWFMHFIALMQHLSYKTPHVTHWLAQPLCPWRTGEAVMLCRAGYRVSPTSILYLKGLPKGKKKKTFLLVTAFCHSLPCDAVHKTSFITKG